MRPRIKQGEWSQCRRAMHYGWLADICLTRGCDHAILHFQHWNQTRH